MDQNRIHLGVVLNTDTISKKTTIIMLQFFLRERQEHQAVGVSMFIETKLVSLLVFVRFLFEKRKNSHVVNFSLTSYQNTSYKCWSSKNLLKKTVLFTKYVSSKEALHEKH